MTEDEADDYAAWKTGRALSSVRAGARMMKEQSAIESTIEPLAKKLGLRIRVMYDSVSFGWHIDAGLGPTPRATYTFDEECFHMSTPGNSGVVADLITSALYDLQHRVFDEAAKRLGELDHRGRAYVLNKSDRDALFDMLRDATDHLHSRFVYAEGMQDAVDTQRRRYEALARKLFA